MKTPFNESPAADQLLGHCMDTLGGKYSRVAHGSMLNQGRARLPASRPERLAGKKRRRAS
jgi:hypothetical protein